MTETEFSRRSTERARAALLMHFHGDVDAAEAAMTAYEGSWPSLAEYVRCELDEHLPPVVGWLFEFLDLDAIAARWEAEGRTWTLLDRKARGVHVFLASHVPARET